MRGYTKIVGVSVRRTWNMEHGTLNMVCGILNVVCGTVEGGVEGVSAVIDDS